ncbi:3-deoxy-7-phosphoheptulonate synthase [Pyrofollis japonicus]|uniref:3-deoxy-7-phosphoheptulonate synthase n=1 Tax=Pyrofollis japonicus TaxID=3060460 RepID=UPI00295B25BF|nr:3-deoxy-7-phosphoheptulonate synthase [Pyrofollis japonicus]
MDCWRVLHKGGGPISFRVGRAVVGGEEPLVIAGPCSVENPDMILETAATLKQILVDRLGFSNVILRGGAWKPRTSPYSFQGHGEKALEWLREAGDKTGLPVMTEVMDPRDVGTAAEYVDAIWVGARNMQNTPLLKELAKAGKPVFLKRHFGSTINEWLCSAEYLLADGLEEVALIERGIRCINEYARFSLDITVVPVVKEVSRLPIIVDVSHPAGRRSLVPWLARAALAAGAHGIMVEVHPRPDEALSDAKQQLDFRMFETMVKELREMGLL